MVRSGNDHGHSLQSPLTDNGAGRDGEVGAIDEQPVAKAILQALQTHMTDMANIRTCGCERCNQSQAMQPATTDAINSAECTLLAALQSSSRLMQPLWAWKIAQIRCRHY